MFYIWLGFKIIRIVFKLGYIGMLAYKWLYNDNTSPHHDLSNVTHIHTYVIYRGMKFNAFQGSFQTPS